MTKGDMMRHWIPVVLFVLIGSLVIVGSSSADWPMFQGSLEKSGYYNGTLPEDDNVVWTFESSIFYLNTPVVADGVVYFSGYDYTMHAVDIRNGEEIWATQLDWATIQASAAVDVDNGLVYIGNLNTLFALDIDSGDIMWKFHNEKNFMETGWIEVSSPAVYNDFVYFGSVDGYLYKFPAEDPNGDGTMTFAEAEWAYLSGDLIPDSEGVFYAPITFCPELDLVLGATAVEGGANPGAMYAVNDADGSLEWRTELATNTPIVNISIPGMGSHSGSGPAYDVDAGANGIVWVPNGDRLYALDITDGSEEYVKTANNWIMGMTPSWDANNVYIGDDDGWITAYDKDTGAKSWDKDMGGPIRTSPVYDNNGNMYTVWNTWGSDYAYGVVSCFNMTTRNVVWEYNLTGFTLASFGVDDGMLFISVADVTPPRDSHLLFAFGDKSLEVDLQVKTVAATNPIEGSPSQIVAKVYNDGTMSAWDVDVEFYNGDPDGSGVLIGTAVAPRLRPGVSTPVFLELVPATSGKFDIYAVVDPDDDVDETIESNNVGSGEITVIPGMEAPTCSIDSISPSDLLQVASTTIEFYGSAADDGTVEYYTWTSSIDGFLSSNEDFDMSVQSLSPGAHYITFQVEDNDGMISANDSAMLFIRPGVNEDWYRSGGDVENTGYSPTNAPPLPTVEWAVDQDWDNDGAIYASPVLVDGVMYYSTWNATYAVDPEDGSEIWRYNDNDALTQAATTAVDADAGVVVASGRNLTVLDIDDGSLIWRKPLGAFEFSGPVIHGDRLYVHSLGDVNITCFNLTTGVEYWNFQVSGGYLYSSPAIGFDHLYVTSYSTDDDNEGYYATYGLDLDTGAVDWRWRLGDGTVAGIGVPFVGAALSIASPTVYSYGGSDYVVVGDITGNVYAFEPDGEAQPRDSIDSDGSGPTPLTGGQDDGDIIWSTDLAQDLIASTAYHDGRVYVITWFGNLYCLNAENGNTVWSEDYQMPFWGAPSITNDTLVLAGLDSYVYNIDITDGSLNWKYLTRPYTFHYSTPTPYGDALYFTGGHGPGAWWVDKVYKFSDFVDKPDLEAASSMVVLPDHIPVNETIQFMVGAANRGTADATAVISVYINETDMAHRLGASKIVIPAGGMNGFMVDWNTTNMSGEHTIIVVVSDPFDLLTGNNMAEVTAYVVKPGEKPLAEIDAIEPNPVERSSSNDIYFSGTGHSAANITDYLWNASGEFLSDEAEFTEYSDADVFSLGDNEITFTVKDDTGQWADEVTETLRITAPGSKPVAEILDISPNPANIDDMILFEGEGTSDRNITGYKWSWSGGTLSTLASFEEDADTFGTGSWPIYFEVEDEDGKKSATVSETLKVVSGDPPVVTISDPVDEEEVTGVITIYGNATSDEDVTLVEVAYGEVGAEPDFDTNGLDVDGTETWSAGWDTEEFSGKMEIHARATSRSGLESEVVLITVTITSTLPTVEITYPMGGDLTGTEVEITGTASDDSAVDKVQVKFGTSSWTLADDDSGNGSWSDWSYLWNISGYDDGDSITIRARATDDDGDFTQDSVTVKIVKPNLRPGIEIVFPGSGSGVLADTITVEGSASDDEEITRIQISVNDKTFSDPIELEVGDETYYYWYIQLDTTSYPANDHKLYARAQDNDGEFSNNASVDIRIDNRVPEAIIDSVKPGVAVWGKDTIIMKGHATMVGSDYNEDRDIAEWKWTTNRGGLLGTNATIVVKAEDLSVGVHEIELSVKGSNGKWSYAVSTQVNVRKAQSDGGSDDEWWEIPGMEATAAMTALAAAILLFRKRR